MLGNNYAPEFFNGIPDKAGDSNVFEKKHLRPKAIRKYYKIWRKYLVKWIPERFFFLDNPQYPRGPHSQITTN